MKKRHQTSMAFWYKCLSCKSGVKIAVPSFHFKSTPCFFIYSFHITLGNECHVLLLKNYRPYELILRRLFNSNIMPCVICISNLVLLNYILYLLCNYLCSEIEISIFNIMSFLYIPMSTENIECYLLEI